MADIITEAFISTFMDASDEATARAALLLGSASTEDSSAFATAAQGTDSRTPTAHAASHANGGSDAVKLDDLAAPDDNTDLNATTLKHGLLPKLGGGTANFLRADGSWATPPNGDMTLAGIESVTGLKTFDSSKIAIKGSSTGKTTLASNNTSATDYLVTVKAETGTVALLSDITGTNSGTNTGDNAANTSIAATKLDDYATPDDNTDLNATTSRHGLLPKLGGGTTNFLRADGTWAATPAGSSDMVLADIQSVTGLKTFDTSKLAIKGSSTGKTVFASNNSSATDYTVTVKAETGTVALLSDITGTNSGTNTGDNAPNSAIVGTKLDDFTTPDDNTDLNATTSYHGLLPKLDGSTTKFLRADGTWAVTGDLIAASVQSITGLKTFDSSKLAVKGSSTGKTVFASNNTSATDYTVTVKAETGIVALLSDITGTNSGVNTGNNSPNTYIIATKLDDFATPDDNTDLNATTTYHGLLPKLGGGTTNFLRADGTWAEPAGGGGGGGGSPTPFNVGAMTGSVTLDITDGAIQYGYLSGNTEIQVPTGTAVECQSEIEFIIQWSSGLTLDFASGIKRASDSAAIFPKTLTAWKSYIFKLKFMGGCWCLVSLVGGFTEIVD